MTQRPSRKGPRPPLLKSPDFFDVATYPTMTFKSTKVQEAGKEKLKVTGDLTIKGKTKSVVLDVVFPVQVVKGMRGEARRGLSATTKIDRRNFGLTWSKMTEAGPLVGNDVAIALDVELEKSALAEKKPADDKGQDRGEGETGRESEGRRKG